MEAVEEIINIPMLLQILERLVASGKLQDVMDEVIVQSRVEFNLAEDEDED
jgi:hypothetical protein